MSYNNNNITNNRAMMMSGTTTTNRRTTTNSSTNDTTTTMTADDSTNFTTGDESSILLRPTTTTNTNTNTMNTPTSTTINNNGMMMSIDKKNSEGSGYHFGNSSVGGSSSVLRPGISYNPTVNTNTYTNNNASGSIVYGGNGGGNGINNRRSMMMTMQNNNNTNNNNNNNDGTNNSRTSQSMNNNNNHNNRMYFGKFCGLCSVYDLHSEVLEYNYAVEAAELKASSSINANNTSTNITTNNGFDSLGKPITTTTVITPTTPSSSGTNRTIGGGNSNNTNNRRQPLPRIRTRGEYYIDTFNDETWSWTMGTNEANGTWCNSSDQAGTIMSAMVWILLLYSAFTVTALTITEGIPVSCGMLYSFFVFMSLASHAKTSFTDPGSVPIQAIPSERQRLLRDSHSMCGQCQTFKPPGSHHCRICNRCIGRMDHHCPWMNNCVGAGNLKHFCLFLFYTWLCAAYSLSIFGWNYFFCSNESCTFHPLVLHLVRLMTLLAIGAFLFTSSMLMNVCYGIMTGIGTIDRLKKKATNTGSQSDEEPIQLIDVFGIGGYWTWPLPFIDPLFDDYDRVMGYTIPSRLDRERQFCDLYVQQQQQLLMQQQSQQQSQYNKGGLTGNIITTTTKTRSSISTSNNNIDNNKTGGGSSNVKTNTSMDFPGKCVNDLLPV